MAPLLNIFSPPKVEAPPDPDKLIGQENDVAQNKLKRRLRGARSQSDTILTGNTTGAGSKTLKTLLGE